MTRRLLIVIDVPEQWKDEDPGQIAADVVTAFGEYSSPGPIVDARWVEPEEFA